VPRSRGRASLAFGAGCVARFQGFITCDPVQWTLHGLLHRPTTPPSRRPIPPRHPVEAWTIGKLLPRLAISLDASCCTAGEEYRQDAVPPGCLDQHVSHRSRCPLMAGETLQYPDPASPIPPVTALRPNRHKASGGRCLFLTCRRQNPDRPLLTKIPRIAASDDVAGYGGPSAVSHHSPARKYSVPASWATHFSQIPAGGAAWLGNMVPAQHFRLSLASALG